MNSQPATFGRAERLRESAEYRHLQRRGARYQSGHFVLYGLGGEAGARTRLGITVSRRIGGAVARNRLKRRVRECYRLKLRSMLPAGAAIVVIALGGAAELDWPALNDELLADVRRLSRRLEAEPRSARATERGRD